MHPRITTHSNAFPKTDPLASDLARLQRLGIDRHSLHRAKLEAEGHEAAAALVRGSGVTITHIVHSNMFTLADPDAWPAEGRALMESIDTAAALEVPIIYGTTGPAGGLTWEEAIGNLSRALIVPRAHAGERGVQLLFETTNPQYADIDCFHSLRDTLLGVEAVGAGICLDIHASWTEAGLDRTIARAAPLIGLVQVSDYAPGSRTLDRAVPGEGVIPLERIIGWILATGYGGLFDIELVDAAGTTDRDDALSRAVANLTAILERVGA